MSAPQTKNELTCDICIDVITDLDNWLTSDKTEQEIVDFMKEVTVYQNLYICNIIVESFDMRNFDFFQSNRVLF